MSQSWNDFGLPVKYKGLINQGATCYLNSVLQVLFMTDDFREAVERYSGTECIDVQLKSLFDKLKYQNAETTNVTKTLDIRRVFEQQDAAEYYEKILIRSSAEASQIFHGMLTHSTMCLGCRTHRDMDDQFWHLPLTLMDSCSEYSVVNGIEDYFKATTFNGENQMYCEQCDDKQDASVQCVMKHHPEVLMLLLKRFQLDYYSMTYFKINCNVFIPYTLQIPMNQTYELYAVVDHVGNLRQGHYTACIKSQEEDRWFKFDDARVTKTDYQAFKTNNFERSDSAYLLFYRKKSASAPDTGPPEDIMEVSAPGGCSPSTSDVEEPQEAVEANGGEMVEEKAETGVDNQMVDKDRNVSPEEDEKPPEPCCQVDDLVNRDYPMQGPHEENDERNDSCLQRQGREKEEVTTAPDNEEVADRRVEAEKKEDTDVQRCPKGSVKDKWRSDDSSQEKARRVVSTAERHVKRSHSERTQGRDRSSHGGAVQVRSRSLPGGQREVRKSEKQTVSDKLVVEEIQHIQESGTCKEEKKRGTQSGIQKRREMEEITLETPPSGTRKRRSDIDFFELFKCLGLNPKVKKPKVVRGAETSERKNTRWSPAKKRSKVKKKGVKTPSCWSVFRKKQVPDTESD